MTVDPRSGYAPSACFSQENQVAMPLSMPELIHAVSTLVQDQVRPTIGILRRRIEELSNRRVECSDIEQLVSSDVRSSFHREMRTIVLPSAHF